MAQAKINRKAEKKMKENLLLLEDERRHADQYKEQSEKVIYTFIFFQFWEIFNTYFLYKSRWIVESRPLSGSWTKPRRKFRVKRPQDGKLSENWRILSLRTSQKKGKLPTSRISSGNISTRFLFVIIAKNFLKFILSFFGLISISISNATVREIYLGTT